MVDEDSSVWGTPALSGGGFVLMRNFSLGHRVLGSLA